MRIFKYIAILVFIVFIAHKASAQQDPLYTQYMNQLLSMNPAYAGAKGVTSATLVVREQWVGFTGHPSTQTFFAHSPIKDQNMGLGLSIQNDKFSVQNNTSVFGDYSYSIFLPAKRSLSFGLKAGVNFYNVALSELDLGSGVKIDPAFTVDKSMRFLPNFGVGFYYSSPQYYLGLSIPRLLANKISGENVETGAVSRQKIHTFFMGGYVFDVNRFLKFKPYFMTRFVPNAPVSIDLTAQAVILDRLWFGFTYRIGDAMGMMAKIKATDQLSVGYAYDLMTNEFGSYGGGTHEVMITFDFSFGRGRVRSPRYF